MTTVSHGELDNYGRALSKPNPRRNRKMEGKEVDYKEKTLVVTRNADFGPGARVSRWVDTGQVWVVTREREKDGETDKVDQS
jgi:hypothetical protein